MTTSTTPPVVTEPVDHHDPLGRRDYLSIEHVERYRFAAAQDLRGCRVLDIACGAGYGTAMLAAAGAEVIGADCDPRTLTGARRRFPGLAFVDADALHLPFKDSAFDVVVTFETIEHVADGDAFLREMSRVLRPGGRLICSTPNIRYTRHPVYHVHEYAPEEFYALVATHGVDVERHGQYIRARDRMQDLLQWRVKSLATAAADAVGVRSLIRRALAGSIRGDLPAASDPELAILDCLGGPADPQHAVRRYDGHRLLRIMITVSCKEGRS